MILPRRFAGHLGHLLSDEDRDAPVRLLVAVSGGLDSSVLLHLLRFRVSDPRFTLTAAHFDHRMRPGSGEDADWVRGVCDSWSVPLEASTASTAPRGEAQARSARYAFLRDAASRIGARWILTAHHADDQAETILFRVLRGTGIAGLRGIPARSRSGLLRPLLPFWREEIEAYAVENHLRWRTDPTNETYGPARNRIRHRLLPEIERYVAPGARRNLVGLAALAAESEAGWASVVAEIHSRLVRPEDGGFLVARHELRRYHPAIGTRVLRKVLHGFGSVPGRIGTRSALQFITHAASGREMHLPDGIRIRIEFDQARIDRREPAVEDLPLRIGVMRLGEALSGKVRLGGRAWSVEARVATTRPAEEGQGWGVVLPLSVLRFPLELRARRAGDRIRSTGGTSSVKKLLIERRVPRPERDRRPLLVDAEGRVLWIAGVAVAALPERQASVEAFILTIGDDGRG